MEHKVCKMIWRKNRGGVFGYEGHVTIWFDDGVSIGDNECSLAFGRTLASKLGLSTFRWQVEVEQMGKVSDEVIVFEEWRSLNVVS